MNNCQICDSVDFIPVCTKDNARYVKCCTCGSVRQYPYPSAESIIAYYKDYKSIKGKTSNYLDDKSFEAYKNTKLLTFDDLNIDASHFFTKSICDVGCATGQFISLIDIITNRSAKTLGIDISDECIEIARSKGLNCHKEDFFRINEKFDFISMFHVIEHLNYPRTYFEHAYKCLHDGGQLLIETPVIGIVSEVFGSSWRYFLANEHINIFTPEMLLKVAHDAGFSEVKTTRYGSGIDSNGKNTVEKQNMDKISKKLGWGDTFVVLLQKT